MSQPSPDFKMTIPEGDALERRVCTTCGFIDYVNPKIVAGAVITASDGRIVMCKRAIEPRRGFWTLPAGFMEEGESVAEAAAREAREEALAHIRSIDLLAIYSVPRLSQVQIFFRAELTHPEIGVGEESLEVALYHWDDIPMNDLAFPTVRWALEDHRARIGQTGIAPAIRSQGEDFAPIDELT